MGFLSQRLKLCTENAIEAFVKAQIPNRRHGFAVFHPEAGITGHAGDSRVLDITPVEVMQIADIKTGIQGFQGIGLG
jgi:hypothetical protein